nr:ATPase subunit 9 [Gastrodia uraiensis]
MLEGAKSMGAGAATIASAGAAVGIGNVFSSLIHSVARNPSLAKQSFGYAILGFALTEAIALFAPMMAFLISFVFRLILILRRRRKKRRRTNPGAAGAALNLLSLCSRST